MKVILLQEVPGLGQPGDVKEVANGYARNYLLPRKLVTAATATAMNSLNEQVASARRRTAKLDAEHTTLMEKLSNVTLTFAVRVGQGDRLYGSVTTQDIANALREQEGITVDRRSIVLKEALRALGSFEAPVRVSANHEAKVKVNIISSEQAAAGVAAATGPAAPAASMATETNATEATEEAQA
jgi:large subunit ribosomal protein L9